MGALVVVNAFGDVLDPLSNQILAGARISKESFQLANSSKWMKKGVTRKQFGTITPSDSDAFNTTLGVIATNAHLTKKEAHQVAQIAHSGLAKDHLTPSYDLRWRSDLYPLLRKEKGRCEYHRTSWRSGLNRFSQKGSDQSKGVRDHPGASRHCGLNGLFLERTRKFPLTPAFSPRGEGEG